MDTNFNLKGHVQIYNGLGECVFDEHNDITDLGKRCILGRMANVSTIPHIETMWYSYGSTNMHIDVDIGSLKNITPPYNTDEYTAEYIAKNNFYTKFFGNTTWTDNDVFGETTNSSGQIANNANSGLLAGSVTTRVSNNSTSDDKKEYVITYTSGSGSNNATITFRDTGDSVSVDIKDINITQGSVPSSYGCFTYGDGNKSLIYYTYIKTGNKATPNFTGISLGSSNIKYTDTNAFEIPKNVCCIIPYTGLSFDLGALVANSTYVIKYTLYM